MDNIMEQKPEGHSHTHTTPSYGFFILIWIFLLALTTITVSVTGIKLGAYALVVALAIGAIKSALVINYFMHIKFEDKLFKAFLAVTGLILLAIFVLTAFDVFFR